MADVLRNRNNTYFQKKNHHPLKKSERTKTNILDDAVTRFDSAFGVTISGDAGGGGGGAPVDPEYIDPTYQSGSYSTFIETAYVLDGVSRSGTRIRKTSGSSSIFDFVVGKHVLTGKRYWEVVNGTGNQTDCYPGMTDGVNRVNFASTGANALWNDGYGWTAAGRYLVNGSNQFSKPAWSGVTNGYTLMFAYDADTQQVYHGRNGVWDNDPVGGGGSSINCSFFGDAYVALNLDDVNDEWLLATQAADCLYTIPTGYSPLLPS